MGRTQDTARNRPSGVRDADATRRRILEAATQEFSAKGLAGGRVAVIADRAPANQRMIYAYYGNKDGLFDAVLQHHILAAQNAVDLDPDDLPGYAQQVFDVYQANPHFVRLMLWQHLERPELLSSLPAVEQAVAAKVAAIEQAQSRGNVTARLPAALLLDHILALTLGTTGDLSTAAHVRREALGRSVARMAGD